LARGASQRNNRPRRALNATGLWGAKGIGVFYAPEPKVISSRLVDVHAAQVASADETWNAHLWDTK
jgi:hypothetical protein